MITDIVIVWVSLCVLHGSCTEILGRIGRHGEADRKAYGVPRDGVDVVGNPWIIVEYQGTWYAATWEWLRPGQECKSRSAVNGDHIKHEPLRNWSPKSGERYWFMVSGLARSSHRNAEQRTNLVEVVWP